MAFDLGSTLTQKIGPFPGWAWALGVGGAIFLLGPKLFGSASSSGTASSGSTSGFDPQSYATGYSQGAMNFPPTAPSSPAASSGQWMNGPLPAGNFWWRWSPGFANEYGLPTTPQYGRGPTSYPAGSIGANSWAFWSGPNGPDQPPVGGAAPGRSASIGSRSANPHAYYHPSMKRQPQFPHFVRGGVGGAAPAHAAAVHQTAHTAGLHPARLAMLNPRPHKFIRVA